jgi:hypothetical protein
MTHALLCHQKKQFLQLRLAGSINKQLCYLPELGTVFKADGARGNIHSTADCAIMSRITL